MILTLSENEAKASGRLSPRLLQAQSHCRGARWDRRMSHPITDMMKWSATQEALAQEFGTDSTVTNPSRVLRLAGTVSHPSERKRKRVVHHGTHRARSYRTMARSVRVLLLPPFPTRSQPGRRQRRSAISQWQTKGRADCLCASSRRPYKQSRRSLAADNATVGSTWRNPAAMPIPTASIYSISGNVSPLATRSLTAVCGTR